MIKSLSTLVFFVALVVSGGHDARVYAEEPEHAAEKKVAASGAELAKTCAACHGEKGLSISAEFPNLAGQYRDYLAYALRQYRSGERQSAVMQSFVTNLTDDEIENLARYYAAQSGLRTLPKN